VVRPPRTYLDIFLALPVLLGMGIGNGRNWGSWYASTHYGKAPPRLLAACFPGLGLQARVNPLGYLLAARWPAAIESCPPPGFGAGNDFEAGPGPGVVTSSTMLIAVQISRVRSLERKNNTGFFSHLSGESSEFVWDHRKSFSILVLMLLTLP